MFNLRTNRRAIMGKKFSVITLVVFAFGFASAARLNGGTEIVRDYSDQAPPYIYTPPPPVYYAPPPVRVVYAPVVRVFGYQRFFVRRAHCAPRCW